MAPRTPSVVIIGAGFGGIAAALELVRHGHDDFLILDKADTVGGVWRENTYPGAACDIPSVLYSYSFATNPRWPSRYSRQPDILAYLTDVAKEYGVHERIRFGVEVTSADFDAGRGRWVLQGTDGEQFEADVLVSAVGQLSRPTTPTIKGQGSFRGAQFHSAEWDHDVDLTGKRVAVIGTGASAIQIVPSIQPDVAHLTLFQRSAPYIIPKADREFRGIHHKAFEKVPLLQQAERLAWFSWMEFVTHGVTGNAVVEGVLTRLTTWHRNRQVADPELRAKLTPDYRPGCKRGLMSSDYYPALAQDNVHVETARIEKVTAAGVVTDDGQLHEVDVIVYCTGFTATDFLAPMDIRGLGGKDLRETWSDGARAYLGITVPDFPNLFLMYGPNTNLGAGSIIYMHERQARYVRQAVEHLASSGTPYLGVRRDVEDAFDAELQERLGRSVWAFCESWYRDANGRVATNWPGQVTEYDRRTVFDPADYERFPQAVTD